MFDVLSMLQSLPVATDVFPKLLVPPDMSMSPPVPPAANTVLEVPVL